MSSQASAVVGLAALVPQAAVVLPSTVSTRRTTYDAAGTPPDVRAGVHATWTVLDQAVPLTLATGAPRVAVEAVPAPAPGTCQ